MAVECGLIATVVPSELEVSREHKIWNFQLQCRPEKIAQNEPFCSLWLIADYSMLVHVYCLLLYSLYNQLVIGYKRLPGKTGIYLANNEYSNTS